MIEVDVFWSFAIGASCAAFAGKRLAMENCWLTNFFFVYTLLVLSLVFVPSGVFLLSAFVGWESMFFLTPQTLHPLLATAFSFTNVAFGILGFYLAYQAIVKKDYGLAHSYWVSAYVCMFAVLGLGWNRFFFSGDHLAWELGQKFNWADQYRTTIAAWFKGPVFMSLVVMGVPLIPALYYPMLKWPQNVNRKENDAILMRCAIVAGGLIAIISVCYLVFVFVLCSQETRDYLATSVFLQGEKFGPLSPLFGMIVAEAIGLSLACWPLMFLPASAPPTKKKKM